MESTFVRETGTSYIKIKQEDDTDMFQMKMVIENDIKGLLRVADKRINNCSFFTYNISSLISMDVFFENKEIGRKEMRSLISSLKNITESTREYLLDLNCILLKPEYIFLSRDGKELKYCFFSGGERNLQDSIKELFEYIIKRVSHKDNEAVTLAYGIYKRICVGNIDMHTLFETEEAEDENEYPYHIIEEKKVVPEVIPETVKEEKEVRDKVKIYSFYGVAGVILIMFIAFLAGIFVPALRIGKMEGTGCLFGAVITGGILYAGYRWYTKNKSNFTKIIQVDNILPFEQKNVRIFVPPKEKEQDNLTVVLGNGERNINHYLKWEEQGTFKKYELNMNVITIGSSLEKADCVVAEEGISRMHARITKEGEGYYIKDLNSRNGTYVNNRPLICFQMCELHSNDIIRLGNTECVFV